MNGLNSTIQASINGLQKEHNSLSNQVNTLLNIVYVLVGLSVLLIIVTTYLATRKPKITTQTEMGIDRSNAEVLVKFYQVTDAGVMRFPIFIYAD